MPAFFHEELRMDETGLSSYQSDHLFLLVGGNPLPNAVAGKLLLAEGGTIVLVHSPNTESVAGRLAAWLASQGINNITYAPVEEANAYSIYNEVGKRLPKHSHTSVGLHYTGGTKAMAVHAYRAVADWAGEQNVDPIFSYLDARSLRIYFNDGISRYVGIHPEFSIDLETLFKFHNLNLHLKRAIDEKYRTSLSAIKDIAVYQELQQKWGKGGRRFEQHIASHIASISQELQLSELFMNVKASPRKKPSEFDPEFDIVTLRGYQLFCISCTIKNPNKRGGRNELKQKLFEVVVRARQLGGDEACVALVCFVDDPENLEDEIQHSIGPDSRVKVFGKKHMANLAGHFAKWIEKQIGDPESV